MTDEQWCPVLRDGTLRLWKKKSETVFDEPLIIRKGDNMITFRNKHGRWYGGVRFLLGWESEDLGRTWGLEMHPMNRWLSIRIL